MLNPRDDGSTAFEYPVDGLFRIEGFVTEEELANPSSMDANGEPCMVVLKDGCATDLTVGRCAGLESILRDSDGVRSFEIAVYNYDKYARPFSAEGDSGSLIFNGKGEMVALLHSGKAKPGESDTYVTYGTPAWRLREWIEEIYPYADFDREAW
jgi:hypothetical protein